MEHSTVTTPPPAPSLAEEHRSLRQGLQPLDDSLHGAAGAPAELARALANARDLLNRHFRKEEESGCLGPAIERQPNLARRAADLLGEHCDLAWEIDTLVVEARELARRQEALRNKARVWLARVHRHEAHENDLVQEAFNTDFSADD